MVSLGDISTEPNLENSAGKALTGISNLKITQNLDKTIKESIERSSFL